MGLINLSNPSAYTNDVENPTDGAILLTDLDAVFDEVNLKDTRIANLESNSMTIGGTKTFSGNVAITGTLGVTGATTLTSATLSTTLGVTGATTLTSATLSTTLGVTGVATFSASPLVPAGATSRLTLGSGTAKASITTAGLYVSNDASPPYVRYNGSVWNFSNDGTTNIAIPTSSGGLVYLSTQTASSSATISFTSGISSTYDKYVIEGSGIIPATNATYLNVLVSEDSGGTWKTGASNYQWEALQKAGTSAQVVAGSAGDTRIDLFGGSVNNTLPNTATMGFDFTLTFKAPSGTARNKLFYTNGAYTDSASGNLGVFSSTAMYKGTTNAINGIQFAMQSGNIASGVFRLYGVQSA